MITAFFVVHLGFICDLCVVTKMRKAFRRPAAYTGGKFVCLYNLWEFKEEPNAILRVTDTTIAIMLL